MGLHRVRATWKGWLGAPGVSTFYFPSTAAPPIDAVRTFFESIKGILPTGITVQVENTGATIDEATGHLTGTWTAAAQAVVTATGTGSYLTTTGVMIRWQTQAIHGRRMLAGKTFLVPVTAQTLAADGRVAAIPAQTVRTAATTLVGGGQMAVWGRPSAPGKGTLVGSQAPATAAVVTDLPVVLRSRRQ